MIGRGKWRRPKTRIATEDAEGRVLDLHALRTTLGTNLARAGVAPQVCQRVMRHADYRTTLKHYTVLGLSDSAAAILKLPTDHQPSETRQVATGTCDSRPAGPPQFPQQLGCETVRVGAKARHRRRQRATRGKPYKTREITTLCDVVRRHARQRANGLEPSTFSLEG